MNTTGALHIVLLSQAARFLSQLYNLFLLHLDSRVNETAQQIYFHLVKLHVMRPRVTLSPTPADKHALAVRGTHHSRRTFRCILALPHRILWHYLSVYAHVCSSSRSTPTVMLSDTSAHAATHARLPTHLVRHAIRPGRHLQDTSHIMPLALCSYSRFVLLS